MRLSCKQADRIFWSIAFCTSLKLRQFSTSPWFNNIIYGTHVGKMSVNVHGLFWATRKKKKSHLQCRICGFHNNVFIKPSFSDPNAPNSNLTSKSIFNCIFSERITFSPLTSHADCHPKSITALLMAHDPDKYTELQYFSIPTNIICSVLSERLGNWWGKTSDV